MTQREWEKTFGWLALVALFVAVCCFIVMMAIIPYESPQYMRPAGARPVHSVPSAHLQALTWVMLACVVVALVCLAKWRRRRRIRISAETYAEGFARYPDESRRRDRRALRGQ